MATAVVPAAAVVDDAKAKEEFDAAESDPHGRKRIALQMPFIITSLILKMHNSLGNAATLQGVASHAVRNIDSTLRNAFTQALTQDKNLADTRNRIVSIASDRVAINGVTLLQSDGALRHRVNNIQTGLARLKELWTLQTSDTQLQAINDALMSFLQTMAGTDSLKQDEIIRLEEEHQFLSAKLQALHADPVIARYHAELAKLEGNKAFNILLQSELTALVVKLEDEEIYLKDRAKLLQDESKTNLERTSADVKTRVETIQNRSAALFAQQQNAIDEAKQRKNARWDAINKRKLNVEREIASIPPDKVAAQGSFLCYSAKASVEIDYKTKKAGLEAVLKSLNEELAAADTAFNAEKAGIQDTFGARIAAMTEESKACNQLLSHDADTRSKYYDSAQTTNSNELEKMKQQRKDTGLTMSKCAQELKETEGMIEKEKKELLKQEGERDFLVAAYRLRQNSVMNQLQSIHDTQESALKLSGCSSLKNLVRLTVGFHYLFKIRVALMAGNISLTSRLAQVQTDFSSDWTLALNALADEVRDLEEEKKLSQLSTEEKKSLTEHLPLCRALAGITRLSHSQLSDDESKKVERAKHIVNIFEQACFPTEGLEAIERVLAVLDASTSDEYKEFEQMLKQSVSGLTLLWIGGCKGNLRSICAKLKGVSAGVGDDKPISKATLQLISDMLKRLDDLLQWKYELDQLDSPSGSSSNSSHSSAVIEQVK